MNKQQINAVYINEYNSGKSIWEIAKEYNNTYKNVSEAITGHRFEARLLPREEKERIVDLYTNGMSTVKLGQLYGVNNKSIAVVLKEYGVDRTGIGRRRYSVNEKYFDIIDTPNKAYILGLLSADGSNQLSKGTISIALEECDKDLLEEIRIEMQNEHPLEYLDYSNKHDFGYSYKNQYRMLIFSTHMCQVLKQLGLHHNKSLTLDFCDKIPEAFLSDYIRGFFDGDGSIGVKNIEKYNGGISVSITSTFSFCNKLHDILNTMGIDSIVSEASNHNGITACLNINKKESKKKFLDWIYNNPQIYLSRKYNVYRTHYKIAA